MIARDDFIILKDNNTNNRRKDYMIIGICDDEKHIHSTMEIIINEYIDCYTDTFEIVHFYSGKEILDYSKELDLVFMDIEMPEIDGIETSKILRKRGMNYKIIMLTVRQERYREAFKINAFRFVPKPIEKNEIFETLDDVKKTMVEDVRIKVLSSGIEYFIRQKDIYFIESSKDYTLIYTGKAEYKSDLSLVKWLKKLDKKMFFKCHKSYIVNLNSIDEIGKNELKLITGERILISRRMRTPLLQAYMEFDINR